MSNKTTVAKDYAISKGKLYFEAKEYAKKGAGSWFSKLGNSLVAVVVVLPFAGLLAAIGGIVMSQKNMTGAGFTTGLILSDMGQTVLSNLGLLFMLAILLGFTNTKGYALFSAIIGYIAFVGFITPFIRYNPTMITDASNNIIGVSTDPVKADTFNIWFWHNLSVKTQLANIFGLGQSAYQLSPAQVAANGEFTRMSYRGFTTLNTGVLGGIVLGFVDVYIYNKGKDLKLPNMLAFFSGEKFSSVVALVFAPVVACLFIIIWPGVNYVLGEIGVGLTYLPYGIDAGVFGIAKQLLIPFEAHQALIAPLWYTAAGGQLSQSQADVIAAMMYRIANGNLDKYTAGLGQEANYITNVVEPWLEGIKSGDTNLWQWIQSTFTGNNFGKADQLKLITDSFNQLFVNGLSGTNASLITSHKQDIITAFGNYGNLDWTIGGDQLMTMAVLNNNPSVDIRDFWSSNLKITRFITGGYANLMFLTPAVGLAMWSTLPQGPRKRKFGFYFGAMLPSFLLGVNEPIIFMFAYTAPIIYYVAYSGICGVLFLFTALFQAKLSSTFSQGLLDYVVNGVIPTVTRPGTGDAQTKLWIPLVIGVIAFVFGFIFFRWLFEVLEFVAPGMEEAKNSNNKGKSVFTTTKPVVIGISDFFGGVKAIKSIQFKGKDLQVTTKKPYEYKKTDFSDRMFEKVVVDKNGIITIEFQSYDNSVKRAVRYLQEIVYFNNMKKAKLTPEQKQQQRVAKVEAKWQIKHDSLDKTTDIEIATEQYKEKLWAITKAEERELAKVKGKEVSPIDDKTKQQAKKLAVAYKKQIKELKAKNKAIIKAERKAKFTKADDKKPMKISTNKSAIDYSKFSAKDSKKKSK